MADLSAPSPLVRNAISALTAGAITLVSPARIPRSARRGVSLARTATSLAALVGDRLPGALDNKLPARASTAVGQAQTAAPFAGATAAGFALVTSGLALKADQKVEALLIKRGVRQPRLVMSLGVVAAVFAINTLRPKIQAAIAERARGVVPRPNPPAGTNEAATPRADGAS